MDEHMKKIVTKKKIILSIVSLFLIIGIGAGVTISYLVANTDPLVNTFTPGKVTTAVTEEFSDNIKSNVSIQNTGNVPAYIRAAIIVNWVDDDGNISGESPAPSTDYEIELGNMDWFPHSDGYYYHRAPVAPGENTSELIKSARPMANKEGYTLLIEILGSGIQSEGVDDSTPAVQTVWPVTVDNNGLLGGSTQ